MPTFKQKALEALKQMELPSNSGFKFELIDQHNQTVRDCIGRIEAIEEEPVWIPVEEKLPEIGTDVLVLSGYFHYDASLSRSGDWVINNTFHTEEAYANGVTHWMPLPNRPSTK